MSSYAHVVHTTAKQVPITSRRRKNENVFKMSKDEKCTCKACKNTVKYENLWGFCCRRRRGCLSSLLLYNDSFSRENDFPFRSHGDFTALRPRTTSRWERFRVRGHILSFISLHNENHITHRKMSRCLDSQIPQFLPLAIKLCHFISISNKSFYW